MRYPKWRFQWKDDDQPSTSGVPVRTSNCVFAHPNAFPLSSYMLVSKYTSIKYDVHVFSTDLGHEKYEKWICLFY